MAFPTGPVENGTIYTDEYGNSFKYDVNTNSWEKHAPAGGEPVLTSGATMIGDLVQNPSFAVRPQEPGELSVNRVDDTKVQFKYMGDDFSTRGFEMDMGCTVDVMEPLLITSQTLDSGSAFVQFGDTLTIAQHAKIRGYSNTADTFIKWQRSDEIGDGASWSDIPGASTGAYAVLETDRGKFIRLVETFIPAGGGLCGSNYEVVSKPVLVTFQMPVVDYFVFTHEFGPGKLHLELSQQTEVYKANNDGNWELVENFAAGSRTLNLNANQLGVYGVQSTGMTHFRFEDTEYLLEINIEKSSKTPALTSLYRAFYDFGYFIQDVSFLNTSNVTNMDEMFALTQIYNAPVNFDVSNVTTARRMFFDNRLFDNAPTGTWYFPKLVNAANMFQNCYRMSRGSIKFSDKLENASNTFRDCREFNGTVNMNAASNCTNVSGMFFNCSKFVGGQSLKYWDTNTWTNTASMFASCTAFNPDLTWWRCNNVVNAYSMFRNCRTMNTELSNMTMAKCTDMSRMFQYTSSFNGTVGKLYPQRCENMNRMFNGSYKPKGFRDWRRDVYYVRDMNSMFSGISIENLSDIDDWNTESLQDMDYFISYSSAYANLKGWDVHLIPDEPPNWKYNNDNSSMNYSDRWPQWGKRPPNFSIEEYWDYKIVNSNGKSSGEGQVGDVLYAQGTIKGADTVEYQWKTSNDAGQSVTLATTSEPRYTTTSAVAGRYVSLYVVATASDGSQSRRKQYKGYAMAGYYSRTVETNSYTVETTDSLDTGLPVRVKLKFTGTESVPYFKLGIRGDFEQLGSMSPGSEKILDLPSGLYRWDGTNMIVLNYDDSAEGSFYEEASEAYKDAVL